MNNKITKNIEIIEKCIALIKEGWKPGLNIEILKSETLELYKNYKESVHNEN